MKNTVLYVLLLISLGRINAQLLVTDSKEIDKVFSIAVKTLNDNVKDSLIHAGGTYGGEWTRDISINAWNAANLLLPEVTEFSLWNVTTDNRNYIGHEYWDKIIWVIGAFDHYQLTQDDKFLRQIYITSSNTIKELEEKEFDVSFGLFKGPSVFNDGIAGYEEPVYEKGINSSHVMSYPGSKDIKCLSTNCIYYKAYELLAEMSLLLNDDAKHDEYKKKADKLKENIRHIFYNKHNNKLYYLIDKNGNRHDFQEGLGVSFSILFGILSKDEALKLVDKIYISPNGIPSIYPSFKRFSKEHPGRHNVMIWPFVNAFWADAVLKIGRTDLFINEMEKLTRLVLLSNDCFYELYNPYTGRASGGWQTGRETEWESVYKQTWSATGYLRMFFKCILGISYDEKGLHISPESGLIKYFGFSRLTGLKYRGAVINISREGQGSCIKSISVNGIKYNDNNVILSPSLACMYDIKLNME